MGIIIQYTQAHNQEDCKLSSHCGGFVSLQIEVHIFNEPHCLQMSLVATMIHCDVFLSTLCFAGDKTHAEVFCLLFALK